MTFKLIKEHFPWISSVVSMVGICCLLFLNTHYVTVEKYEQGQRANEMAHSAMLTTLSQVDKTLALQAQNNELLVDMSKQIKQDTIKITEFEVRIKQVESLAHTHTK